MTIAEQLTILNNNLDAVSTETDTQSDIIDEIMEVLEGKGGTDSGGSVEGTAIPVRVPVEKIYFNTALSIEETNAYLSQLSYVQTDLVEMPVYCICYIDINEYPIVIFAQKTTNDLGTSYQIISLDGEDAFEIYNSNTEIDVITNGGFVTISGGIRTRILTNGVYLANHIVQGDFMGIPVGAENEKIKNVLSITPFGASGGSSSNKPTAYTVSSVDELPSDAVDGSTAIVPNDSLIGKWEWKDNQSPLDLSMFNFPNDLTYDERIAINGYDPFLGVFNDISFSKVDSFIIKFGNTNLYVDDAFDDSYTIFSLYTDILYIIGDYVTEENFKEFIKTNCNRLSGGHSLYTRENGEWVYKCEVV